MKRQVTETDDLDKMNLNESFRGKFSQSALKPRSKTVMNQQRPGKKSVNFSQTQPNLTHMELNEEHKEGDFPDNDISKQKSIAAIMISQTSKQKQKGKNKVKTEVKVPKLPEELMN
jgi:hypothetical protein